MSFARTRNPGAICPAGERRPEGIDLKVDNLYDIRQSSLNVGLTKSLLYWKFRDPGRRAELRPHHGSASVAGKSQSSRHAPS
jgi:hypothetical protein